VISICVVTHNQLSHTQKCLDAILNWTDVEFELTVCDSGSSDGTPEFLSNLAEQPQLPGKITKYEFVHFTENVGAAIAYNEAFSRSKSDVIIRIDNDVVVPYGWASRLLEVLGSDPQLGMLTTELVCDTETEIGVFSGRIQYVEQPVWHDCGIGSWCIAMRREMFDQVGVYRPLFGVYALQDNDLEKRAQNVGWRLGTLLGLKVRHLYSMETPDEAEYNTWKIQQYNSQIESWNAIWGKDNQDVPME